MEAGGGIVCWVEVLRWIPGLGGVATSKSEWRGGLALAVHSLVRVNLEEDQFLTNIANFSPS